MSTYLLLDVSNICYRHYYASQWGKVGSSVKCHATYGLLRELGTLQSIFQSNRFVFCFDGITYARREIYPFYKLTRRDDDDTKSVRRQIESLRRTILPAIGYKNLYYREDCEADDLIAMLCAKRKAGDNYILCSTDSDLYQLLTPDESVIQWQAVAKSRLTYSWVKEHFDVTPEEWPLCKAIIGCKADNIPGIESIGVKAAAKWINSDYIRSSCQRDLLSSSTEKIELFKRLTTLPFDTLDRSVLPLCKDSLFHQKWDSVIEGLKLESLLGRCPL